MKNQKASSSETPSNIQSELSRKYDQSVSVPTIIDRERKLGYYQEHKKKKHHDREVLTRYSGERIHHDSSHHKFAPNSQEKWYLITSLDDNSTFMLYADSHSIFRFVQGRNILNYKHSMFTDDVDPPST